MRAEPLPFLQESEEKEGGHCADPFLAATLTSTRPVALATLAKRKAQQASRSSRSAGLPQFSVPLYFLHLYLNQSRLHRLYIILVPEIDDMSRVELIPEFLQWTQDPRVLSPGSPVHHLTHPFVLWTIWSAATRSRPSVGPAQQELPRRACRSGHLCRVDSS